MQSVVSKGWGRYAGVFLLVIGFCAGLAIGAFSGPANGPLAADRQGSLSVMLDFGNGTITSFLDVRPEPNETLFALTRRLAQKNGIPFVYKQYPDLGAFIMQIGSSTNSNTADDLFWQYWVNDRYAQTGADSYAVRPGDVIMWKLTKGQQ